MGVIDNRNSKMVESRDRLVSLLGQDVDQSIIHLALQAINDAMSVAEFWKLIAKALAETLKEQKDDKITKSKAEDQDRDNQALSVLPSLCEE